jgi:hypothetical protein
VKACAMVNRERASCPRLADAIIRAADEVIEGS